ncbi:hypothetical protein [Xanthomonas arboricola]|uniref:hypothetical protein n=1 Tax=Xanthomonas arboricola TaxID=56448 RepID=UPI00161F8A43|nr:hypothetical protein [Xanthomonas arboricola]
MRANGQHKHHGDLRDMAVQRQIAVRAVTDRQFALVAAGRPISGLVSSAPIAAMTSYRRAATCAASWRWSWSKICSRSYATSGASAIRAMLPGWFAGRGTLCRLAGHALFQIATHVVPGDGLPGRHDAGITLLGGLAPTSR